MKAQIINKAINKVISFLIFFHPLKVTHYFKCRSKIFFDCLYNFGKVHLKPFKKIRNFGF